jgi:hypothetical protein
LKQLLGCHADAAVRHRDAFLATWPGVVSSPSLTSRGVSTATASWPTTGPKRWMRAARSITSFCDAPDAVETAGGDPLGVYQGRR